MKKLRINNGLFTLVDDDIAEEFERTKISLTNSYGYAVFAYKKQPFPLHRKIMGLEKGDKKIVDHINRNRLDNRRANLRIVNRQQNAWNKGKRNDHKTSKYHGVSYEPKNKRKWLCTLQHNGKNIAKSFNNELEAAKYHDTLVIKYRGEFGVLNFPNKSL